MAAGCAGAACSRSYQGCLVRAAPLVAVLCFTGKTPSETKRPVRQLLTAFGTNAPACWRAEDIDLVVETGRGCPFAWTMFQHPRHCASFR